MADAEADFAIVGDLPAQVQAVAVALQAVFGDGVVVQDRFDVLRFGEQVGRDEPARAGIERLIELGVELLMIAQLQARQPFRAQFVDAVLAVAGADIERAVATKIIGQVQPQAQVVGTGAFLPCADDQDVAQRARNDAIFDLFEILQTVQGAHVLLQALQVQGLAEFLTDMATDHPVADLGVVLDANPGDHGRARLRGPGQAERRIAAGVHAHAGQAPLQGGRGAVAGVDQLFGAAEIGGAVAAQGRLYQQVLGAQGGQLGLGIASGHHGSGLIEHIDHRQQFVARLQRRADIHHDEAIDTHVAGDVHGNVVDHAAIDQQAALDLHRREHRRDRHAGADGLGQMAAAEYHLLVVGDIGGHGAEGNRQVVEVARIADVHQQPFQQEREVLALDHAERQAQATVVTEAQFLLDQEVAVILLAAKGNVLARRVVGQHLLPIQRQCQFLQLGHAVARCVEPANHRAHAGASHCVDVHAVLFQRLEHADVSQSACGSSGKHQAGFRLRHVGESGEG